MTELINLLFFLLGGGQPGLVEDTYTYIDYLYTAIVADGSQIPPVVFTNDMNLPEGMEERSDAFVICMKDLPATPSARVTQAWFDAVKHKYLADEPHIFHDSGGEFIAKTIQDEFRELM